MINVKLLSLFGHAASAWESEIGIGAAYPCDLWLGFVLTVDDNEDSLEHEESGENSEYREIIFHHRADRATEIMWRAEVETSRAHSGMPNNPVGFVEGF